MRMTALCVLLLFRHLDALPTLPAVRRRRLHTTARDGAFNDELRT
jgi:hypothetical protein